MFYSIAAPLQHFNSGAPSLSKNLNQGFSNPCFSRCFHTKVHFFGPSHPSENVTSFMNDPLRRKNYIRTLDSIMVYPLCLVCIMNYNFFRYIYIYLLFSITSHITAIQSFYRFVPYSQFDNIC